jgi:hypothetical protein
MEQQRPRPAGPEQACSTGTSRSEGQSKTEYALHYGRVLEWRLVEGRLERFEVVGEPLQPWPNAVLAGMSEVAASGSIP